MNNPAAELRGIKDVIPACPESFFAFQHYCVYALSQKDSRQAGMTE
jgi:hypothetical protein